MEDEALVQEVLRDPSTSRLDDKHKALFLFLDQVNHRSTSITAEDTARLRVIGWTDEELYYAITVCALFNFYNRWITATGVPEMSEEAHHLQGQSIASRGYARE
jgi:alkylhydroperoxidase family enzyme